MLDLTQCTHGSLSHPSSQTPFHTSNSVREQGPFPVRASSAETHSRACETGAQLRAWRSSTLSLKVLSPIWMS